MVIEFPAAGVFVFNKKTKQVFQDKKILVLL